MHPGGSVGARLPWDASLGNTSELQMAEADGIVRSPNGWRTAKLAEKWKTLLLAERISQFLIPGATLSNTSMSKKRWLMTNCSWRRFKARHTVAMQWYTATMQYYTTSSFHYCLQTWVMQTDSFPHCMYLTYAIRLRDTGSQEISRVCSLCFNEIWRFKHYLIEHSPQYLCHSPLFSHVCCSAWESPSVLHRMQAVSTLR